jgi:Fe-S-cluster containining protein
MFESAHQCGLRFECRQCSSCCSGGPGYVWLSEADINLLANHLNLSVDTFIQRSCRFVEVEGGKALSLRERKNYDCIFLENGRCSVYEARPAQCRRYPFWEEIIATEEAWKAEQRYCPGVGKGDLVPPEAITDAILELRANPHRIFPDIKR